MRTNNLYRRAINKVYLKERYDRNGNPKPIYSTDIRYVFSREQAKIIHGKEAGLFLMLVFTESPD